MNKLITVLLVLAVAGLGVVGYKAQQLKKEKEAVENSYQYASAYITDFEHSLDALMTQEKMMNEISSEVNKEGKMTASRREEVLNNITAIGQSIEANKQMLSELQEKLKKSEGDVRGLQSMVKKLKSLVNQKEQMIVTLKATIDTMQVEISGLKSQVEVEKAANREKEMEIALKKEQINEKEEMIKSQETEMNTIYYVVDTKKRLLEHKIIEKNGGFLGLGRAYTVAANISEQYLTPLNLQENTKVIFDNNYKEFSIITHQEKSSYKVTRENDVTVFEITDKAKFRSIKILVIMLS